MRISDWISDVCTSDLADYHDGADPDQPAERGPPCPWRRSEFHEMTRDKPRLERGDEHDDGKSHATDARGTEPGQGRHDEQYPDGGWPLPDRHVHRAP